MECKYCSKNTNCPRGGWGKERFKLTSDFGCNQSDFIGKTDCESWLKDSEKCVRGFLCVMVCDLYKYGEG